MTIKHGTDQEDDIDLEGGIDKEIKESPKDIFIIDSEAQDMRSEWENCEKKCLFWKMEVKMIKKTRLGLYLTLSHGLAGDIGGWCTSTELDSQWSKTLRGCDYFKNVQVCQD